VVAVDRSARPARSAPRAPAGPAWRRWNLVALTALTSYSTAIGWQAQRVSYPLYGAVGVDDFPAYHRRYDRAIPLVVVAPGFATFLAGAAFPWTRPGEVPARAAAVVSAGGVTALLATVLWAIPRHDRLNREGWSEATLESLLRANLVRSLALSTATAALCWCLGRTAPPGGARAR
jgi:hypothetical protein